jgi:hypothetical protein
VLVACLAKGLVKVTRRVDLVVAEKEAVTQPILTRETLVGLADAVAGTVAAHPDRIDEIVSHDWLAALIHSVAGTMSHEGVLETFTRGGLETMAVSVLHTFGKQPELIVRDPGLARHLLGGGPPVDRRGG